MYDYDLMQKSRETLTWVNNVVATETMRGMFTTMVTELINRKQLKAKRELWQMPLSNGDDAESDIIAMRYGRRMGGAAEPDMKMRAGELCSSKYEDAPDALRVDKVAANAMGYKGGRGILNVNTLIPFQNARNILIHF